MAHNNSVHPTTRLRLATGDLGRSALATRIRVRPEGAIMNLEEYLATVNRNVFLREFSFHRNQFKAADRQEYELADHVIWVDDMLIAFQLKQREPSEDGAVDHEHWFEKKVLKRATKQIRDTIGFLQQYETVEIENQRGHRFKLRPAAIKRIFMVVVYDLPPETVLRTKPNHYRSKTAGFIHLLRYLDYAQICETLITPAEIADFLEFRERILGSSDQYLYASEQSLLGQFLSGKRLSAPSEDFAKALERFRNDISHFDLRLFFDQLGDLIHSHRANFEIQHPHYATLTEFAKLDRFALEKFRERMQLTIENCLKPNPQVPFRMIDRSGTCFLFFAVPSQLHPIRLILLENLTIAAKYDVRTEKCVGTSVAVRGTKTDVESCRQPVQWNQMRRTTRTCKRHTEILPASLLSRQATWQQVARSLPPGGYLLVVDARNQRQIEQMVKLGHALQKRGRFVRILSIQPGCGSLLHRLPLV